VIRLTDGLFRSRYRFLQFPNCSPRQDGDLMSRLDEQRQRIVAKVTSARSELEDALSLATHALPHGSDLVPEVVRLRWASIIAELNNVTKHLEDKE